MNDGVSRLSAGVGVGGLRGRKRSLFEGGVRVPGLAEWPKKIKANSVTSIPAVTSDYLPTILDAIGAEAVEDRPLDGISLLPLFAGEMKTRSKPISFESSGQLTLINNQYKIVRKETRGKREKPSDQLSKLDARSFMLFDLQADRAEERDVAVDHVALAATQSEVRAVRLRGTAEVERVEAAPRLAVGQRGDLLTHSESRQVLLLLRLVATDPA